MLEENIGRFGFKRCPLCNIRTLLRMFIHSEGGDGRGLGREINLSPSLTETTPQNRTKVRVIRPNDVSQRLRQYYLTSVEMTKKKTEAVETQTSTQRR